MTLKRLQPRAPRSVTILGEVLGGSGIDNFRVSDIRPRGSVSTEIARSSRSSIRGTPSTWSSSAILRRQSGSLRRQSGGGGSVIGIPAVGTEGIRPRRPLEQDIAGALRRSAIGLQLDQALNAHKRRLTGLTGLSDLALLEGIWERAGEQDKIPPPVPKRNWRGLWGGPLGGPSRDRAGGRSMNRLLRRKPLRTAPGAQRTATAPGDIRTAPQGLRGPADGESKRNAQPLKGNLGSLEDGTPKDAILFLTQLAMQQLFMQSLLKDVQSSALLNGCVVERRRSIRQKQRMRQADEREDDDLSEDTPDGEHAPHGEGGVSLSNSVHKKTVELKTWTGTMEDDRNADPQRESSWAATTYQFGALLEGHSLSKRGNPQWGEAFV